VCFLFVCFFRERVSERVGESRRRGESLGVRVGVGEGLGLGWGLNFNAKKGKGGWASVERCNWAKKHFHYSGHTWVCFFCLKGIP